MRPETMRILREADDPVDVEGESREGGEEAWRNVRALVPALEAILGKRLELDENVQDASFMTDIALREETAPRVWDALVAVRFSNFGRLYTVWTSYPSWRIAPETVERIIGAVRAAGFVYVEAEELQEPYTGRNPALEGSTWWIRFFDYV